MKKIILTIFLFATTSIFAFAQSYPEFAPVGAQWNYTGYNFGNIYPIHINSIAQDTIAGHACKKLKLSYTDNFGTYYYVYRDSLKMYIAVNNNTTWKILYDFTKVPGDSFYTHIDTDSIVVHVTDTADTVLNGHILPMMKMATDTSFQAPYSYFDGWAILNVGALQDFFFPQELFVDGEFLGDLRCYHDALLSNQIFLSPCDTTFTTGILTNSSTSVQAFIAPNPNNGCFTLSYHFNQNDYGILEIYTLQGKKVFKDKLNEQIGNKKYHLQLPAAVYLYKVTTSNGNFKTGKILLK